MDINNRIKEVRKYLKLSQESFGESLGMSRAMVVNLEMDKLKNQDQVKRYCKAISNVFNVNEEWLLTGEGDMLLPPPDERAAYVSYLLEGVDDPVANAIMHFVEVYMSLDDKDKLVLRNFIDKLTNKKE